MTQETTQMNSVLLQMARTGAQAVMAAYDYFQGKTSAPQLSGFQVIDGSTDIEWASYLRVWELVNHEFIGFVAYPNAPTVPLFNVMAFRGTQTTEESLYDVDYSPTPLTINGQSFGNISTGLHDFYLGTAISTLNDYVQHQITGGYIPSNLQNLPLLVVGHSLGGGLATLAAAHIKANGWYPGPIILVTFGSLHVGDQGFYNAFQSVASQSARIANLADFVPQITGVSADYSGYVHVGTPYQFLWHNDTLWANHSMVNVYQVVVDTYPDVLSTAARTYPNTGIPCS